MSVKTAENKMKAKYSKEMYLEWYSTMVRIRRFEEKTLQMYGLNKVRGFCHVYIGQEAIAAGIKTGAKTLDPITTGYRQHGLAIMRGIPMNDCMAELFGKATGCVKGKGGSMHFFNKELAFFGGNGIVGAQIGIGTGLGFAEKYKGTDYAAITMFGDGAARQGILHECFNMAMTWKLPILYICENNKYAMGTSVERTSNVVELYKLGSAYEMPSEPVDGMSVEEIHLAVSKAAERARSGNGPTLLEFNTYRYKGHSMSDPAKYRTKEELEEYKAQDPLEQVKATILENKFATEAQLLEIEKKIKDTVLDSVKFAEDSPYPVAADAYNDVYVQTDYPYATD